MRPLTILITGMSSSLSVTLASSLQKLGMTIIGTSSKNIERPEYVDKLIPLNFRSLDRTIDNLVDFAIDAVIHVAALTPRKSEQDFQQVNVDGPLEFFSSRIFKNLSLFVNMSSTAVYGARGGQISEYTKTSPASEYGYSKLAFESSLTSLLSKARHNPPIIHLRIPTLLGQRVSPGLFHRWVASLRAGEQIQVSNPTLRVTGVIDEVCVAQRVTSYFPIIPTLSGTKYEVAHSNGDITFLEAAHSFSNSFGGHIPIVIGTTESPISFCNIKTDWWTNISTAGLLGHFLSSSLKPSVQ